MDIDVSDRRGLNIEMWVGSIVRNWNTRFIIFNNRTTTIRTPAPHTLSSAQSQKCSLEYMFNQYSNNSMQRPLLLINVLQLTHVTIRIYVQF